MNTTLRGIAVAFMGLLLAGCESTEPEEQEVLRPVRYQILGQASSERLATFNGQSKSRQESRLSFKVNGTVVELPVKVGDQVKAGDLIAALDSSSFRIMRQQADAALLVGEANARNAKTNYRRIKGLYASKSAARNDLDVARAASEAATAEVNSLQQRLELARLDLAYTRLLAKRSCSVASVDVELNENVTIGQQIALVTCGKQLEIKLDVPESVIGQIKRGDEVDIHFSSIEGDEFKGRISEVGVTASSDASTFPVTVDVESQDRRLRAGLAADVSFSYQTAHNAKAFVVPLSSVQKTSNEAFVFVAVPTKKINKKNVGELQDVIRKGSVEAKVSKKKVSLGQLSDAGVEINGDIKRGDFLITAGATVLQPGQRVLISQTKAAQKR